MPDPDDTWNLSACKWHCPFWDKTHCPSLWVKSQHDVHEEILRALTADNALRTAEIQLRMQTALESKQAELATKEVELHAVIKEILEPTVKPRGFMHSQPSQPAAKVKSGWLNKMCALLGAIQTVDHERMESLVALCSSCILNGIQNCVSCTHVFSSYIVS
jgi:hypothetical protein